MGNSKFRKQHKAGKRSMPADRLKIMLMICFAVILAVSCLFILFFREVKQTAAAENGLSEESLEEEAGPELDLNGVPELNDLFRRYFDAMAGGDADTIAALAPGTDELQKIRIRTVGGYIDHYPTVDVYSYPGPEDGTYVCFVVTKLVLTDGESEIPGLQTLYVCTDENGQLYINDEDQDAATAEYIKNAAAEDEVVDLNNEVIAEYNDLIAQRQDLEGFIETISQEIDIAAGEALAEAEDTESNQNNAAEESGGVFTEGTVIVAQDTVNVRMSDSRTAETIGSVSAGDKVTVIEGRENGWTKIDWNGQEGFVKSEYFRAEE